MAYVDLDGVFAVQIKNAAPDMVILCFKGQNMKAEFK